MLVVQFVTVGELSQPCYVSYNSCGTINSAVEIVQMVEHVSPNRKVGGLNPLSANFFTNHQTVFLTSICLACFVRDYWSARKRDLSRRGGSIKC